MEPDLDGLLAELGELYSFIDVDVSEFPAVGHHPRFLEARALVLEAADVLARAMSKAHAEDPAYRTRAEKAVRYARQAVKKARPMVLLARLREKLR